jgi:hypothetical protein
MDNETQHKLLQAFGSEILNRFSLAQLYSKITFILRFPELNETETKTNPLQMELNVGNLFEEIKRIFPQRSNTSILVKFRNGIEKIDSLTGERTMILENRDEELNERLINDRNRNLLRVFLNHHSMKYDELDQTLDIDVYFQNVKSVRLYVITKSLLEEKSQAKIQNSFQKIFKQEIYNTFIIYLNDYNETPLETGENDLLLIIVDETFMKPVVEKEIDRANIINILGDPKNQETLNLQQTYKSKILAIHKSLDILMSTKNFNIK